MTAKNQPKHDVLYTIGHSTHDEKQFVDLLKAHGISAVCDVRSIPYSRRNSQFNRELIAKSLKRNDITYVFLGEELGAKNPGLDCCVNGKVQFNLIASTREFQLGLDRIRNGMKRYVVTLMCAEEDPLKCHRTILISRHLRDDVQGVTHIRGDGKLETNESFESRLLVQCRVRKFDLFDTEANAIDRAYDIRGQRISVKISNQA